MRTEIPDTSAPPAPVDRHTLTEDILGIVTGAFAASLGLFLLKASDAVTGGTVGLALLANYAVPLPYGIILLAVNLPFFALAAWKKGWNFTLRTITAVTLISILTSLHGATFGSMEINPVYGVLAGNMLAGVGLLILFRHRASAGGIDILALVLQDKLNWRAGYTRMTIDIAIVLASLAFAPPVGVLLSAAGAALLSFILVLNHRPLRYQAS